MNLSEESKSGAENELHSSSRGAFWAMVNLILFFIIMMIVVLIVLTDEEIAADVPHVLELVDLQSKMLSFPHQLSGGEKQRVAIARAIVNQPDILIADEPTGDLDARSAEEILTLMETLNREFRKTIVMVTHDPRASQRAHTQRHLDKGVLRNDA